jgi:5-methylcytosine-specific restriction endonuclease McrA
MKQLSVEERFCIDCKTPTKGYGVRCPKCNNIKNCSNDKFREEARARANKRYENPEERIKTGLATKVGYLKNPLAFAKPKGKDSPIYKGRTYGVDYLVYCVDCGSALSRPDAVRCVKCANIGIHNPNYIHGNCNKFYRGFTEKIKKTVRLRDVNYCQECGFTNSEHLVKYGCSLPVHHIDYNKANNILSNLISLCVDCHLRTNHNRSYWQAYFEKNQADRGL